MAQLSVKNLSMQFNDVIAVDNVSFNIKDGEFVTLLGPSGCGKTTILLALAGIYTPTVGEIYFNEKNVSKIPTEKRNIGIVFQNYALYPHLTVFENIAFPLKIQKLGKEVIRSKIEDISEIVHIEELLKRKPSELSGGQQQRVAIARALVKSPEVLLLDEPLSNLDVKLRLEMREEILSIQKRSKITTIFVTHDQDEALSISDQVFLMNHGKVIQSGSPHTIYNNPLHLFAAKFIGSMINTFQVEQDGGHMGIKEFHYPVTTVDKDCVMCTRAENIRFAKDGEIFANGILENKRISGKDILAAIKVNNTLIHCYLDPDDTMQIGELFPVHIDEEKSFFFDRETEARI